MQFKTTGTASIHSVKCCVVFDRESGAIQHVHRVVTMTGAAEKSEAEIEERALNLARERGIPMHSVQAAHVDAEAFNARANYKIDTKTKALRQVDSTNKRVVC